MPGLVLKYRKNQFIKLYLNIQVVFVKNEMSLPFNWMDKLLTLALVSFKSCPSFGVKFGL
jgi:hypothetical protein